MKKWIIATRPWSFPASAMPALAAIAFVCWKQQTGNADMAVNVWNGVLALLGAMLFQAAGNLIGDYFDFKHKVDRKETFGSSRMLVDGVFMPHTILWYGITLMCVGAAIGLYLLLQSGTHLLWIGAVGVLSTYFYYFLKYRALGDLLIFIIYGQLIALGTAYAMTGSLDGQVLLIAAPIGFLVVNILHANNTRDILHDGQAHIRTLAMWLGIEGSKKQYAVLCIGSYAVLVLLVAVHIVPPLALLALVTCPLARKNILQMQQAIVEQPERIKDLDASSAQLVMMFSLLMAVSILVTRFFL